MHIINFARHNSSHVCFDKLITCEQYCNDLSVLAMQKCEENSKKLLICNQNF